MQSLPSNDYFKSFVNRSTHSLMASFGCRMFETLPGSGNADRWCGVVWYGEPLDVSPGQNLWVVRLLGVRQIEVADRVQRLGGRRVLKRLWQGGEPGFVFGLQHDQLGHRVVPAPGTTAAIGGASGAYDGAARPPGRATTSLPLGVAHGSIADRLTRHAHPLPL